MVAEGHGVAGADSASFQCRLARNSLLLLE